MLNVNLKKMRSYGDRLDDGAVQLSFTFPIKATPEAKEAARQYAEKLGLEKVLVATMEPMGESFTYFVVYGSAKHSLDFTRIKVPKIDTPDMDFATLKDYMAANIERPIVVIGAATGSDAHTVGIDAIMNMKGFGGDYGLERYPLFKAHNLRSQLTNQQLLDKAHELKADAILISQVVTQRDSHIKNLKEFLSLAKADKRIPKETIFVVGGPRLDHAIAIKLGFHAGFGTGTKPSQVASFIVRAFMKGHGIKEGSIKPKVAIEKTVAEKVIAEKVAHVEDAQLEQAPPVPQRKTHQPRERPPRPHHQGKSHPQRAHHPTAHMKSSTPLEVKSPPLEVIEAQMVDSPAQSPASDMKSSDGAVAVNGAPKRRRRRGRRGGRNRNKKPGNTGPQGPVNPPADGQ